MAFADPQSVVYSGTTDSLPRVSSGPNSGRFWSEIDTNLALGLDISHSYGKRTRRMARITLDGIVASPFSSTLSLPQSTKCYLVLDTPADAGVVAASTAVKAVAALADWLVVSSHANALAFCQGQS